MSFSRVKTVDVEMLLCASYQSYFNIFLPGMACRWIFIYVPWWLLVFPYRELKKCQGSRGWKASWTDWYRIIESKGQKRLYMFLRPVMLWSLNLHLWLSASWWARFCWSIHGLSLWAQLTLKIWLKFICLEPSLEVQVYPPRDTQNNWILVPRAALLIWCIRDVSPIWATFFYQCFLGFWIPRQMSKMIFAWHPGVNPKRIRDVCLGINEKFITFSL